MESIYKVPHGTILFSFDDESDQVRARLQKWIEGSWRGTVEQRAAYPRLIRMGVACTGNGEVNQHDVSQIVNTLESRFRQNVIARLKTNQVVFYTPATLYPERLSVYVRELFGLVNLKTRLKGHQNFGLFRRAVFDVTPSKVILDLRDFHLPCLKPIVQKNSRKPFQMADITHIYPELNERTGTVSIVTSKKKGEVVSSQCNRS